MIMEKYVINQDAKIIEALSKINDFSLGQALVLFVVNDDGQIIGSLTDGDIRRALLAGITLNQEVTLAMNKKFNYLKNLNNFTKIKSLKENLFKVVPHVTEDKKIISFINLEKIKAMLPLSCVIMAGGKGLRLRPYTDDTPKPLLMLEEKPIIVHNIDRLMLFGIKDFYISVNHMKDKIINYLDEYYKDQDVSINYIEENVPLGTIGSVSLVEDFAHEDILVLNADLLTNIDFEDFYAHYLSEESAMSVATFNVKIDIPYAVLETQENRVSSLVEKPTYVYYSNAGIYLIQKKFKNLIPSGREYHSIDLLDDLIKAGQKVAHYPIRGYWLDIGKPDHYRKAQDDIGHIKF